MVPSVQPGLEAAEAKTMAPFLQAMPPATEPMKMAWPLEQRDQVDSESQMLRRGTVSLLQTARSKAKGILHLATGAGAR